MNSKLITAGLLTGLLLVTAVVTLRGELAWMALPFLFYLGFAICFTPTLESLHLQAERHIHRTPVETGTQVEVTVTLRNQGRRTLYLVASDEPQELMSISSGHLSSRFILPAGGEDNLVYSFVSQRGNFNWKNIRIQINDPLGLIENEFILPAEGGIQVHPETEKYRAITMHPRSTLHAPGSIPARLGGSGTDFWGVREYHAGDSLRWLDWRLTARHPRKFFTKEFEQEEIADIGLILDARQKTNLVVAEDSLVEHSISATASLAEMFLHQGHRVSMLVFGKNILNVYPDYGKIQLNRIKHALSSVSISPDGSLDSLEFIPIRLFPNRALIIIISPLALNDISLFPRLRAYGYQVLLISPDPLDFAAPTFKDNIETRLAVRAAALERRLTLRNITRLQIPVINWQVHRPLYPLVRETLSRSRFTG
ncbi:MAG: DUF58 domain-containing protein [Anaerolineae bacterium]|nr:DUF58 domain-containing protein [Anaerolineae bacterium]